MMIKFTYCKNFAHAETKETDWDDFARVAVKSVGFDTKEQSIKRAAIVGGVRADESVGRAENIATRTMASLDYDDLPKGTTLDDIELALMINLDCAFTAYTTFRHTPENPRFRVFVPLSRPVTPEEYPAVVDAIRDKIGLEGLDDCSYTVNQIMFLASHKHGVEPWNLSGDKDTPWNIGDAPLGGIVRAERDDDDLSIAVINHPLDLTPDQVDSILENYPPHDLDYDDWLRVGMAIYHQTEGSGYEKWLRWSEQSPKHNARQMKTKWRSFGGSSKPVTMASIIKASGGLAQSAVVSADSQVALTLEAEAEQVSDRKTYSAFKQRVQALNDTQLSPDIRSLLAKIVYEVYAKEAGMGLRELKASFKPPKKARVAQDEETAIDCPEWLEGWVYGEADCLFINTNLADYAIKREAFRAKFDRMPEVVALETDAANFALNMVQIPTVVRGMYWPGQPILFKNEGKAHVNTYYPSGISPCDVIDQDGQQVVDLFLQHVRNTISDEREGNLLIDFMSYVYKNEGSRVRWGMLLWGIEGNGKTYFFHVLQQIMGRNATVINTSMIERPFNDWAVGSRLIGIEEIRISGTNKWRVLDQLKPMISNDSIAVEPKGATRYHAPNFASYLMTTNHQDAVPMSDNDRRYCVIFTRHREQEDLFAQHGGKEQAGKYFDRLFSESNRRADAIARFLLDHKVSDEFNPQGRAPITEGLAEMKKANVSDDRQAVEDAIDEYRCAIVSDGIIDTTHLKNSVEIDGKTMPQTRALANVLRDLGYQQGEKRRVKIKAAYHYVWFKKSKVASEDEAIEVVRNHHLGKGEASDDFEDVPF
jgi:hypothetical protein